MESRGIWHKPPSSDMGFRKQLVGGYFLEPFAKSSFENWWQLEPYAWVLIQITNNIWNRNMQ